MTARRLGITTLVAATLMCGTVRPIAQNQADVALRAAIETEIVEGDLASAIEQYQRLAEGSDRAIAAQALLRMAGCYEKLGQADAERIYQRIVNDFADQPGAVAEARARAALLGRPTPAATGIARRSSFAIADNGYPLFGTVSADGRYIAVSGSRFALFVHDLVTGSDRRVTEGNVLGAAFSPDNRQLAYERRTLGGSELRIVSLGGSGVPQSRQLLPAADGYDFDSRMGWAPDGSWIAVSAVIEKAGRIATRAVVGLVSPRDGSFRVLKTTDEIFGLVVSPDGRYLAVHERETVGRSGDIVLLPTDGGAEIPALVRPGDDIPIGWTREDGLVISNSKGLAVIPITGTRVGEPEQLNADLDGAEPLGMTDAGALYYLPRATSEGELRVAGIDFQSGDLLSPAVSASLRPTGTNAQPVWSHDGEHLAWVSSSDSPAPREDSRWTLTIQTRQTGTTRELRPNGLASFSDPQWAADNQSLIMAGWDSERRSGIFRVNVQTAEVSAVRMFGSDESLERSVLPSSCCLLSEDGSRIVFVIAQRPTTVRLVERHLASGVERELFSAPYARYMFDVRADGRVLYRFLDLPDGEDGEDVIIARDLETGSERELLRRRSLWGLHLSPDGLNLVTFAARVTEPRSSTPILVPVDGGPPTEFESLEVRRINGGFQVFAGDSRSFLVIDDSSAIWWVPLDGREPREIPGIGRLGRTAVHPDGTQIVFRGPAPPRQPTQIWVLENFLPRTPGR